MVLDSVYWSVWVALSLVVISGIGINLTRNADKKESRDNKSLLTFRIFYPVSLVLSVFFWMLKTGMIPFSNSLWITGIVLFCTGFLLRWISVLSLGKMFTVQIAVRENHELITTGIYKWIRHPSYTGLILYYTGIGMMMHNIISLIILVIVNIVTILYRIKQEEIILKDKFGIEYSKYQKSTCKLFPFIF